MENALSTTSWHYEYLVMPFGLANSPSLFQSFMNDVFRDMLDRWVIVYIDDILIYSNTLKEHIDHPHMHLIYTHTLKPLTHTDSLRSLDLPRLSFLSFIPMFYFCVLDLGRFPVILIVLCLPRPRIVSPELCLLAVWGPPLIS